MELRFPNKFRWGVSSAAYSIEGAWNEDGKGESIWDRFAHRPGSIADGSTGDTACDHYHRYNEDVALMAELGIDFYRFSISWPRVLPEGRGKVNPPGLDFYSRLVDALLARGIEPLPVLYQWDLPQALQEEEGWENPDTAQLFADYAATVQQRLGDRVHTWITHNEPFVPSFVSYYEGVHPPGVKDLARAIAVSRQILLSHGLAVQALRSLDDKARLGLSTILFPIHPAGDRPEDQEAARRYDGYLHRWFLDPLFKGGFPEDMLAWYRDRGISVRQLDERESRLCSRPLDFLGVCYFSRFVVREGPEPYLAVEVTEPPADRRNDMGWEIYPQGMYEVLKRVHEDYSPREIMVSENGIPLPDRPAGDGGVSAADGRLTAADGGMPAGDGGVSAADGRLTAADGGMPTGDDGVTAGNDGVPAADGRLNDSRRSEFLARCLAGVHRAIEEVIPVSAYSIWSLLDNLEWDLGLSKRFGLVYVDYNTLARIPKKSFGWYRSVVQANAVEERPLEERLEE